MDHGEGPIEANEKYQASAPGQGKKDTSPIKEYNRDSNRPANDGGHRARSSIELEERKKRYLSKPKGETTEADGG